MKLTVWDRVLVTIYVLITLAVCALTMLGAFGIDVLAAALVNLTAATNYWYIIVCGLMCIIALLGIFLLRLIFFRGGRRAKFVTVDSGENGKVIIAMDALDQMVRQATADSEGVTDMKIAVRGVEDSISVGVELTVLGGMHLPSVTMNLQRDIRRYIEVNCGVAVRDVAVTVGAVLPPESNGAAPRPTTAVEPEPPVNEEYTEAAENTSAIEPEIIEAGDLALFEVEEDMAEGVLQEEPDASGEPENLA